MAIRAVNDHIAADDRVEVVMLPIADGLTIAAEAVTPLAIIPPAPA